MVEKLKLEHEHYIYKLFRKADSEPDGLAPEQRPPRRHARHAARLQHRQDRLRRTQPLHGGPGHTLHPQ